MKQIRPGVVMTFSIKANIYGALAARVCGYRGWSPFPAWAAGCMAEGAARLLLFMYRISLKAPAVSFSKTPTTFQFMRT